ncbi:MAG: c-type cytochrome [Saprospiraceae bacterium]|uniref:C-type cytochrome n=1 Tax=Candidatus Defluviibacterium haderslevense TaxID=2981993 RepID=A0A9D7XDU3_9BACT|nr:c-type cytochrome [Candidatus Defluviibacterium haderslevense]
MKKFILFYILGNFIFFSACDPTDPEIVPVLDTTPYVLKIGDFPTPDLPADNPLTIAGVQLGRMLFYEKKLSKDLSQSCADCHQQKDAFSDIRRFSVGVDKLEGDRQAMAVMNLAWHNNGLFWDGRAATVRDQSLGPIQNPIEMHETLPSVIAKLSADKKYKDQFIRAFGTDSITALKMSLAMEQFMFTMVSTESKYDKYLRNEASLSASEERGRKLFFTEFDPTNKLRGAECFHCHANANFTNDDYKNNGLDIDSQFKDLGRYKVTNLDQDKAKFKVPSLRNIEHTAPYMHDGRFATLEEVIDHYNSGVKNSKTVDILMQYNLQPGGLKLTLEEKADLIAFLKSLSDPDFLTNAAFKTPF